MTYYAHSVAGQPETEWEPLARHLTEVADGARCHGQRFGVGALAELAGLAHDLGKYGADFQARVRGAARHADHSTAGAAWAAKYLPKKWGRLLAHVVAGHHAGLVDDLFGPEGRIEAKGNLIGPAVRAAEADGVTLPKNVMGPSSRGTDRDFGFRMAFLTRMIFSCLLDADRTAAAMFEARATGTPAEPVMHPSIANLETALHAWMARRPAKPSQLNILRDNVLRAAVGKAAEPQGVFTLTVPTGGGKTLTSLAFALAHARAHGLDRVIVVIPFTSIIEQTARVYRDALGDELAAAVLEHHSAFEMEDESKLAERHVGPDRLRLAMERWDSPIVVTTAVQFFESLFSNRPSRCRKLHSLARSVVVVDEAQTLPLPLLRPCVAALQELARNYGSSIVLCTATQPALTAPAFPGGFKGGRELAPDVPKLFASLRRVTVRDIGVQDDAALSTYFEDSEQVLCIVNQRAHARALFKAIQHLPGTRHLSTCMHSVHRARVLAEIRADLAAGRPCRVVSTSLVEAGVDVDFPRVLRATAGLDQIAQAAGRCNREFSRPAEESEVLVFAAPEYGVIQSLKANAESGQEALRLHADDPFSPDALHSFFMLLYARKELDQRGVLEMCRDAADEMNFPFESIAVAMRFIEDTMVPVIVGKQEAVPGEVAALVGELRFAKGVGGIARKLGRYSVGVPRRARSAMLAARVAEAIRPDEFGDQFVVLHNLDLYTAEVGLDWEDVTFRTAEGLMVG